METTPYYNLLRHQELVKKTNSVKSHNGLLIVGGLVLLGIAFIVLKQFNAKINSGTTAPPLPAEESGITAPTEETETDSETPEPI